MTRSIDVGYPRVEDAAVLLADRWKVWTDPPRVDRFGDDVVIEYVYGVPRGGCVPAALVARHMGIPLTNSPTLVNTLVVDDLVDTGKTLGTWDARGFRCDALFRKSWAPKHLAPLAIHLSDEWLHFPWELITAEVGPTDHVTRLLQAIGEDPTRAGLVDTPSRVVKALIEMTSGRDADITEILGTVFEDTCDEMVVLRAIDFTSTCEHHLLPFSGTADVAYIPNPKVVGISKLVRLVDAFAHRLQVQERLTEQIADALLEHLNPKGIGVLITAKHSCMGCRGVRRPGAEMVTSALRGAMRDDPRARGEFLDLRK